MINQILNSKTKTIGFATILLSFFGFLSRVLGLFRDNLLANLFLKEQTDIYFAAFRIPDFIYGILFAGGIAAVLLPMFAERIKQGHSYAHSLLNSVFTFFIIVLFFISTISVIFAPWLIKIITPGFSQEQQELTVNLTRIMLLSPVFLGISAIFSSILQYFNLFLMIALAPIFYNLGIIFGILFLAPMFNLAGLAWGVILGAFLHLLIQFFPIIKTGFLPRFSFNFKSPYLWKTLKLMIPRTFGMAAYHINLIIATLIASTLSAGAISVFNFSKNLQSVPVGLIAIPFATVSFVWFARIFADKDKEEFSNKFSLTFSQILFLIIPLSWLVFLFRAQIVRLILGVSFFGNGYFDWTQTKLTAASLGIFSFSLFAACLIPFLVRIFFSVHNTKTPVKITIATMILNIILCYSLTWLLSFPNVFQQSIISFLKLQNLKDIAIIGLILAFSISIIFQFILLIISLKKQIKFLEFTKIYIVLKKVLIASFLMAILTYLSLHIFALFIATKTVFGVFIQLIMSSIIAISSYLIFCFLLKLPQLKIIFNSILNQFKR